MDKGTRDDIERATQSARRLLEEDFAGQMEGSFDILRSGHVAPQGGAHLSAREHLRRGKVVAAIQHKRAAGMSATEAVADYIRDAAFTALNRFVALKMLEARELTQECITRGEQSRGYKEFWGLAPGVALLPGGEGYRLYIECLFDELSTEIKVLFDRRDAASVLWPRRHTFEELLGLLNEPELATVWGEEETVGWVYQYFNSAQDRERARYDDKGKPKAPQNSRDLAVRNQFFTPRYVVQFLTDNTLGRIWYEMRQGATRLAERCEYLVRRPGETYPPRAKKDPRDLRILDPACGSGHFLLYAFVLLLVIYEEAWADPDSPLSEVTGHTLRQDYPELAALQRALPELVLRHNLYGVDIDPRCAQIAQLALWMRAQRAYSEFGIARADRPRIRRANIVVAEPMPGDGAMVDEFAASLEPPLLGELFKTIVAEMRLAGELGLLLRVEADLAEAIGKAREQFLARERELAKGFLPGLEPPRKQGELDLAGIDDEHFFEQAETRIADALKRFATGAAGSAATRLRLFAEDAVQGLGLVELAEKRYDVVLMNPPFGEMTPCIQEYADKYYPEGRNDIYAVFVRRGVSLASATNGYVGAITSRAFTTGRDHRHFRRSLLRPETGTLRFFVDLGAGVLDGAMVETAAYVVGTRSGDGIAFFDARSAEKAILSEWLRVTKASIWPSERFLSLPQADLLYDLEDDEFKSLQSGAFCFEPAIGRVTFGLTTKDDFRFVRLRWEIPPSRIGAQEPWVPFAKGGEYSWFTATTHLLVNQAGGGDELAAFAELRDGNVASTRRSSAFYFKPSVCFSRRSQKGFSARRLRPNACFSDKSAVIVPNGNDSPWLYALAPVLASSEYQRLIAAQSKFGSYEIGPVKALPLPDERALAQRPLWERIYSYFDEIEAADETSETFGGVPHTTWSPSAGWHGAREALVTGLQSCGLTPDERVVQRIEAWVQDRAARFSMEASRRSWAVGVAFGRFVASGAADAQCARLGPFEAPDVRSPAMAKEDHRSRVILVDDRGHKDDIVEAVLTILGGGQEEDLRTWLSSHFFSEHLATYSASRRVAPIYWQIGLPSGRYSVWVYYLAISRDYLFKVQTEYAGPKLAHEERRLEALRHEFGAEPRTADRKALASQETFVEELRELLDDVKRVAPLWSPNLDDGVTINFSPLWRLVPQNKVWQTELKATWDGLCNEKYEWAHLAMHLWPERVVPKCAADRSLAIAHGLEDVFWCEDADGKWKHRDTPLRPVEELVRERSSASVKAALQSLLQASAVIGNGRRPSRRIRSRGGEG